MRASIERTATFSWSPPALQSAATPLLATGTVSGALDESFSNDALLEIWHPFPTRDDDGDDALGLGNAQPAVRASLKTSARFNRLAWGYVHPSSRPRGVIAAGMENGELDLWDAGKMLDGQDATASLIKKNTQHTGPVKGLAFNDLQPNLLGSGAVNGEIFIWDLTNPEKPYSPGQRSRHLSDITSFSWNRHVPHVLATASNSGYTVVWDLKSRKEVVSLSYAGGAIQNQGGNMGPGMGMQGGQQWGAPGRTGLSAVAWHPDNTTKLVTASEDDSNPIIMVWDLRNSRAPEKTLVGHEKGILSLAWCNQDSDLLLSCGKDCRTIAWNPSTGEIVGEVPSSNNWAHEVQWCPRNPDLLATASFDGEIGIHSLQSTGDPEQLAAAAAASPAVQQGNGADIFNSGLIQNAARAPLTLSQTPKWLKRPVSASFGFAGKLVSVTNKPAGTAPEEAGGNVTVHNVVTEPVLIERAVRLREALESGDLASFCGEKEQEIGTVDGNADEATSWKLLRLLFNADSRDELVTLLGFSTESVRSKVEDAIKHFKSKAVASRIAGTPGISTSPGSEAGDDSASVAREPLVTFDVPGGAASGSSEGGNAGIEATPSEAASALSDGTKLPDGESELTEPSLFGDDNVTATAGAPAPTNNAAADFYASIRAGRPAALPDHVLGLGAHGQAPASSAAATQGSRASSVISGGLESVRATTFKIYPAEESDAERLITRALVLGDFESAVSLCLSSERFADALLLATRGGPELLARTQKAYFEKRTATLPYLRLFQSIVSDDLTDVVQNADLAEWQEIFVILCTFAKKDEFAGLAEQLGDRLQYQYSVVKAEEGKAAAAKAYRKNAVLCYLAAGKLERVVGIWVEEMKEEEARAIGADGDATHQPESSSRQTAHAKALQSFIEKVTVFQSAAKYVDVDLAQPTREADVAASGARTYKLAPLYDAYVEYAELLASQGLINVAVTFISMTPADYKGSSTTNEDSNALTRQRLEQAAGVKSKPIPDQNRIQSQKTPTASNRPPVVPAAPPQPAVPSYGPYGGQAAPATSGYGNTYGASTDPYAPAAPAPTNTGYDYSASPYGAPPAPPSAQPSYGQPTSSFTPAYGAGQPHYQAQGAPQIGPYTAQSSLPRAGAPPLPTPPPPASQRKDVGAWNDAPAIVQKRAASAAGQHKAAAITSPFGGPGAPPPFTSPTYGVQPGQQGPPPPPSRSATRTPAQPVPPPPRPGQQQPGQFGAPPPPPHQPQPGPYQPQRPMSVGPGQNRPGGPPGPPPPSGPYAPPQQAQQQAAYDPYAPPPQPQGPPQGPPGPGQGFAPPGQRGPPGPPGAPQFRQPGPPGPPQPQPAATPAPPAPPAKPKTKYPPGDREHIPDADRPIFEMLSQQMALFKQAQPAYPKKMVDDTERRINVLFDHLNCESVSRSTATEVLEIVKAIRARDLNRARQMHLQLLTSGPASDDLSSWMPGLKALIPRG